MTTVLKIQLSKAIQNNELKYSEMLFIMDLTNENISLDNAILTMMIFARKANKSNVKVSKKYNIQEHIVLSNRILDKISNIEINIEELENEL